MRFEEFLFEARLLVFRLAKLLTESIVDESIKREPDTQRKMAQTVLTLLTEAETLEKELKEHLKTDSDKSISD